MIDLLFFKNWKILSIMAFAFFLLILVLLMAWQTILNNWAIIIIGIIPAIIITCITYYFGLKREDSAEKERRRQAKNEILNILENKVINKQYVQINNLMIERIIRAVGRRYSIKLLNYISSEKILEDLLLRFEESHHLEPTHKAEYTEKINEILDEISAEDKQLPSPVSEIIKSLEESIDSNEKERSIKYLNKLKNAFFDYYLSTDYKAQRKTKMYFMTTLLMIFYAMVILLFFNKNISTFFNQYESNSLLILILIAFYCIAIILIVTYLNTKKKINEQNKNYHFEDYE